MDYILQCSRRDGAFVAISIWEGGMEDFIRWSNSVMQKLFFNFRITEAQKNIIVEYAKEFGLIFEPNGLREDPEYSDFALEPENNKIIDIRHVDTWENYIIKTPLPQDEVIND